MKYYQVVFSIIIHHSPSFVNTFHHYANFYSMLSLFMHTKPRTSFLIMSEFASTEIRARFAQLCASFGFRILPPLPRKKPIAKAIGFFQLNPPSAGETHLRWMKSLRDEISLRVVLFLLLTLYGIRTPCISACENTHQHNYMNKKTP